MTERHIRTITRAVTWRITAILLTLLFTDASTALAVGVVHTIAHYIHERIWLRVEWGRYVKSLDKNHDAMDTNAPQHALK